MVEEYLSRHLDSSYTLLAHGLSHTAKRLFNTDPLKLKLLFLHSPTRYEIAEKHVDFRNNKTLESNAFFLLVAHIMDGAGHIESWTADEVVTFLASLELEQYSDDFVGNEITGDILIHLDHESLREIGVGSVGHRLNILRAVYDTKVADHVTLEPEHYVPATAELSTSSRASTADLSKDIIAMSHAIQLRALEDERLIAAETEIKRLTDMLTRLKDQLIPVFKVVKELQPLPTPDLSIQSSASQQGLQPPLSSSSSLSRKFSTKKLFLGSAPRQLSPTHTPAPYSHEPDSPHSPNRYMDGLRTQTPNSHTLPSLAETPRPASSTTRPGPPPPRPPPPGNTGSSSASVSVISLAASAPVAPPSWTVKPQPQPQPQSRDQPSRGGTGGNGAGAGGDRDRETTLEVSSGTGSGSAIDAFKSFRIGLEDPCFKVLPVALKKYRINADWRDYNLYICHSDQERCLGMDEKPLLIFQELQRANMSPVFMLRRVENGVHTNVMPFRGGGGGGGNAAAATGNNNSTSTPEYELRF